MTDTKEADSAHDVELVAFRLGEQSYCIDIMQVREIRGWTPATCIPHAPAYVMGVINLRGTVLPIIDLAARFGQPATAATPRHAIIVTQIGSRTIGLLVDAVSDIITINQSEIQPTPDVSSAAARSFIKGVMAVDGTMISIISTENLMPESAREAA
jgi:purine-binding chemotaxis protein CheW